MQVPAFCKRQVLTKSWAGSISLLSGMVTSVTNLIWSVQVAGLAVGVIVGVALGKGVGVEVGTATEGVGDTWVDPFVVGMAGWVRVTSAGWVCVSVGKIDVGVDPTLLGILQAANTTAIRTIKDIVRYSNFISFPS